MDDYANFLPDWAESKIEDGSYMHVRAALPTKDGRATGNATIIALEKSRFTGEPLAIVATDAGNMLKLSENEVKELFHPPQYIMTNFLHGHQKVLREYSEDVS